MPTSESWHRRRVLRAAATGAGLLAGCTDVAEDVPDVGDAGDNGAGPETETDEAGSRQTGDGDRSEDGDAGGDFDRSGPSGYRMFAYGPANSGNAGGEAGPTESVTERWSVALERPVKGQPAVVDGWLYVATWESLDVLDAKTGERTERLRSFRASMPTVDGDRLYHVMDGGVATIDRPSLHAGDAETAWTTGQVSVDLSQRVQPPAVVDGTVYTGDTNDEGTTGDLVALDAETGDEQWRLNVDEDGELDAGRDAVASTPAVVDGTVYAASLNGLLYAVDAEDGTENWRFDTGATIRGAPTVVDGTVFVGSDYTMYAIDAADGSEVWSRGTAGGSIEASPAVADDTVYVGSYGGVTALDHGSGEPRWTVETKGNVSQTPVVANGTVYANPGSTALGLDTDDGTERWRFEASEGLNATVVVDGIAFLTTHYGTLYALETP